MKIKIYFLLCLQSVLFYFSSNVQSQTKEIEDQIHLVENSLSGGIKFEGITGDNLQAEMDFHKVKGLSIAVIKNFRIIWAKGYGWADEGEGQRVTANTLFMAASVSKSVNSMGVMKLVQDKKLDLNGDVNDYLVSWKFPYDTVSKGKKITTKYLLSHTAGLNDAAPQYTLKDSIPTVVDVLNGTKASKLIYSDPQRVHSIQEPGKEYSYSNNGIGITQLVAQDLSKKPYEQYMQETVFNPLSMTSSCYNESSLKKFQGRLATGYSYGYEVPGKHLVVPLQSAGGLWTTPTDLARFIVEVQLSLAGKSNKVLSQETVQTMLTPFVESGLGFFIQEKKPGGEKYFTHSGIIKGFRSEYVGSFDDGNGIVVMINSDGKSGEIITEVINSVATVYGWKDFYSPLIKKKPIHVSEKLLTTLEGVYVYDDTYFIILKKENGASIWWEWEENKIYFSGANEFYNSGSMTSKELITDLSGNVIGLKRFLHNSQLPIAMKVLNPDTLKLSATQLTEISWYLLENKRFNESVKYYKKLLTIQPQDLMSTCNMAHCFLFLKDYSTATKLYKEVLTLDEANIFENTIVDDFIFFKSNGFETNLMKKALTDLKLEIPKAFKN